MHIKSYFYSNFIHPFPNFPALCDNNVTRKAEIIADNQKHLYDPYNIFILWNIRVVLRQFLVVSNFHFYTQFLENL